MSNMKLSFLVSTLGSRELEISRLLDSFANQTANNFDVVIVAQGNYSVLSELVNKYKGLFEVDIVNDSGIGLSRARNLGIPHCQGDFIVISDDDCWYPEDSVEELTGILTEYECDILLTQIYDPINSIPYKKYPQTSVEIKNELPLFSKSSIEIAFRNEAVINFDESFGLGAMFVCCEEVDFLIRNIRADKKVFYYPYISVFHERKIREKTKERVVAKGALYRKNFGLLFSLLVLFRDLLIKHENNILPFFQGYNEYRIVQMK